MRSVNESMESAEQYTKEYRNQIRQKFIDQLRDWIDEELKTRDIPMTHLALDSSNSPTTIYRMRNGKDCRLSTIADVADALGYKPLLMFVEKEEQWPPTE